MTLNPWPWLRRLAAAALAWAAIGFVLVLFGAALLPLAFGMRTYVVQSGSMTPTIRTGDLEISERVSPGDVQIGDIVMFKDPDGSGKLISHRVRAVRVHAGRAFFVTRGDANTSFEHWSVPGSGTVGLVVYRLPKLGYVIGGISSPPGKILLIVLPSLVLLVAGLRRIWRADPPAPEPAGEGSR